MVEAFIDWEETPVQIKDLGFHRYNIMNDIINEAFELGVSIYPGAWGKPEVRMKY